jgi:hypothetical protein
MPANFRSAYLVQGQALGTVSTTITLTADGQVLQPADLAQVNLESDDTTAANRTFTILDSSLDGQVLNFIFTSGTSTTAQLADSGNCALSAAWEPTQYDSLTLMWNARTSKWVEIARVDN